MSQHTDVDLCALVTENCTNLVTKSRLSLRACTAESTPEFWCYSEEQPVGQVPTQLVPALSKALGCPAHSCCGPVSASVRIRSIQRDKETKRLVALKVRGILLCICAVLLIDMTRNAVKVLKYSCDTASPCAANASIPKLALLQALAVRLTARAVIMQLRTACKGHFATYHELPAHETYSDV